MAASGSFQSNNEKYCNLYVEWKVTAQSYLNNTSTVQVNVYLKHHALNIPSKTLAINFGGTVKNITTPAINIGSSANTTKLGSATFTAWHNADGTKSVTISATMPIAAYCDSTYFESVTASGTASFNQIARPTTPTLSATTVELGKSVTITMNRNLTWLTHTLTYSIGSVTDTIGSGLGTSKPWTPEIDLAHQLPKSISGIVTITCKTYSGSTLIGTKSVTLTVTVPASVVPTVSTPTFADPTDYATKYGNVIQYFSKYAITVNGAGAYSSTITGFKIEANGQTMTLDAPGTVTTDVLKTAGANTITVTVTDSRGRSASVSSSRGVLAYEKPRTTIAAYRCNANGTENPDGTYIKATIQGRVTALNNKNSKTFKIQYKKSSEAESAYESNVALTYNSAYTCTTSAIFAANEDDVYNVRAVAIDDFNEVTAVTDVSTAYTIIDFKADGKGIAFGKASTETGFDVDMTALFRQGLKCNQSTGTHLAGNQGKAIIDSTAAAGAYTTLAKLNSTNGFFAIAVYGTNLLLNYTDKETVDAGTNEVTRRLVIGENGNVQLAGTIYPNSQSTYYVSSDITKLNSLYCVGDVTAKLGSTDQCSLVGTNERINKLLPHPYSLIRNADIGPVSTTQTTYNTFNGRKISDYGMILITMGCSETDVRATLTIPRAIFDNTPSVVKTFYLDCFSGNGATFNQIAVKWVSDTKIMIYTTTSTTLTKYVDIYGLKVDDTTI